MAQGPIRVLCRYHPGRDADLLVEQLSIHCADVDDDGWTGSGSGNRWRIRGKVDADNAGRLRQVLCCALLEGLAVVDVSGLAFCDVAGVRAFCPVAETLAPGRRLVLVGAGPVTARIFSLIGSHHRSRLRLVEQEDER